MMNKYEEGLVYNFKNLGCLGLAEKLATIFSTTHVRETELMEVLTNVTEEEFLRIKAVRAARLLKYARLANSYANLDMLEFNTDRNLDKVLMDRLASCNYIKEAANIIIVGAAGTGKTFISKALGVKACNEGFRTRVMHLRALLRDLSECEKEDRKTYETRLKFYSRIPLLIIDEWLSIAPSKSDLIILHELIDARYGVFSTIICSQMPTDNWAKFCGNIAIGEAITGRLKSHSYCITLEGEDLRNYHTERP